MKGKIVLFGASGYTGRLTAEAMVARGMRPVLAARSREKLGELAARLGGLEWCTADVSDPSSVAALVEAGDVLVSTVGPFTLYGEAALEAAVTKRAHYLDSTGEPGFIRGVFEDYGPRARAAGVALLTASGYDYVPGNCAAGAALLAAGHDTARIDVGYFVRGKFEMSQGTRSSIMVAAIDPGMIFSAGRLVEMGGPKVREFDRNGKQEAALSLSSTEHYSLPRAYPSLQEVNVYLGWFGKRSYSLARAAALQTWLMKLPGVRPLLRAIVSRTVKSQGRGPDAGSRASSHTHVIAEAFNHSGELLTRADLTGAGAYDFTGSIMAWMAQSILDGKLKATGAAGPVEAFGLDELIKGCKKAGLELEVKK